MYKPDDTLPFHCISHFHTAALLSFLLSFLRVLLSFWLYLSWPHAFRRKINRIHKRELSGVPKETSPTLDPHTSISIILSRRGKSYRYFIQKMGKKNKNKNYTICKAICVSITQDFSRHLNLNNVY